MFNSQSVSLTINNAPVKVHAFSTGEVSVKTKFRDRTKTGVFAQLDFIFDKQYTEWMPIWVWVIEHPEGIFVIDTGENSNINDPGYFKSSGWFASWFNRAMFKFRVNREQEIDAQLATVGIRPEDVKAVLITHLHLDHIDGLRHFPKTPIIVHQKEWEKPYGDLPKLYPDWFAPELITLSENYECFDQAHYLTAARDLVAIHTPGHTNEHISFLLKTDQGDILFAGDICYNQEQMLTSHFAGVDVNAGKSTATYQKVKGLADRSKLVFLPSHDSESAKRLVEMDFLKFK
jgi:glyoxylase-like metal-dependent hydrolase (beta-lactamase superfamily II)